MPLTQEMLRAILEVSEDALLPPVSRTEVVWAQDIVRTGTQEGLFFQCMCNKLRTLTPNEKAELQKQFRQTPARDPNDFVAEAGRVRMETNERAKQGKVVGCFQVSVSAFATRTKDP